LCCSVIICVVQLLFVLFSYYLCCSVIICVVQLLFVLFSYCLCCSVIICVVQLLFVLFSYYVYYSMYCLRVNGYWTTATGCLPNCSWQIYHIVSYHHKCVFAASIINVVVSPCRIFSPYFSFSLLVKESISSIGSRYLQAAGCYPWLKGRLKC
jgi:hypothetical protein